MADVLSAVLLSGILALIVWLKVVRPVRGDLAWKAQEKRIEQARARRLARTRRKRESVRAG
jgi:hypothetical protein